jgi:integrase
MLRCSSRMGGGKLTERAVNSMVKRAAVKAGIDEDVSPHWLRHAHGSHAIDQGATLPEVQSTRVLALRAPSPLGARFFLQTIRLKSLAAKRAFDIDLTSDVAS